MTMAEVRIVFASGHIETFDMEIEVPEDHDPQQLQDDLISLAKATCGHGINGGSLDAMWALMTKTPLKAYCINTRNVDFLTIKVK